jgi:hypothetical protein
MSAARTAATLTAAAIAGAAAAGLLLRSEPPAALLLASLTVAAAFGIGWEMSDAGTAAALFLLLAAGGLALSVPTLAGGRHELAVSLLFATSSALTAAVGAWAGAALRERSEDRSEGREARNAG